MRINYLKTTLKTAVLVASVLLLGTRTGAAQQQVNLTAGPATLTLPDGSAVPMWGYSCGAAVTGGSTATCAKSNPAAAGWSPVVITVPTGQGLTVNLTNSLTFGTNSVPTSLTIVGQLGGGLGAVGSGCTGGVTCTTSPDHTLAQNNVTWPIANPGGGDGTPPPRVHAYSRSLQKLRQVPPRP